MCEHYTKLKVAAERMDAVVVYGKNTLVYICMYIRRCTYTTRREEYIKVCQLIKGRSTGHDNRDCCSGRPTDETNEESSGASVTVYVLQMLEYTGCSRGRTQCIFRNSKSCTSSRDDSDIQLNHLLFVLVLYARRDILTRHNRRQITCEPATRRYTYTYTRFRV